MSSRYLFLTHLSIPVGGALLQQVRISTVLHTVYYVQYKITALSWYFKRLTGYPFCLANNRSIDGLKVKKKKQRNFEGADDEEGEEEEEEGLVETSTMD